MVETETMLNPKKQRRAGKEQMTGMDTCFDSDNYRNGPLRTYVKERIPVKISGSFKFRISLQIGDSVTEIRRTRLLVRAVFVLQAKI